MPASVWIHRAMRASAALAAAALLLLTLPAAAAPQLPDFTYQGRLSQNGAPANGNFNLDFALFNDAVAGGQVGATISEPGFPVVDGLFTVSLAFPGRLQRHTAVAAGERERRATATAPGGVLRAGGAVRPQRRDQRAGRWRSRGQLSRADDCPGGGHQ